MKLPMAAPVLLLLTSCSLRQTLPSYGVVPKFHLTDQMGRPFYSERELDGKIWVANFIFTNCAGPCPRMTAQMRHVRDTAESSPDLRLVSFTVDPARDTPGVLADYARRFAADPKSWYFLTGPQSELHRLCRGVFQLGDVDGTLQHSTRFMLIDRKSRIRGYYDSSDEEDMRKLMGDIASVD